jgi:predicted NBD/HSP70 family sugar kinase
MVEASPGSGAVLRLIRDGRATTRSHLAQTTGLSRSTLAERVHALLDLGLVHETNGASTGGRPPATLEFNPTAGIVLAACRYDTFCRIAICTLDATPLIEHSFAVHPGAADDALRPGLEAALALAGVGAERLWAVGLGVEELPAGPGLPAFGDTPVLVDRRVNLLALAEQWTHWHDVDHLLYVFVGTTISCGIVTEGRIHRGARGAAGGLGHISVPGYEDVVCVCGNSGCLEAVVGGPALAERLRASGLEAHSPADVAALARRGVGPAVQAVRAAGRAVGEVLAECINFYNPGAIVLGGELAEASHHLLAGLRETAFARSLPMATRDLVVSPAELGTDADLRGAAVMAIEHVLAEEHVDRAAQRDNNLG